MNNYTLYWTIFIIDVKEADEFSQKLNDKHILIDVAYSSSIFEGTETLDAIRRKMNQKNQLAVLATVSLNVRPYGLWITILKVISSD